MVALHFLHLLLMRPKVPLHLPLVTDDQLRVHGVDLAALEPRDEGRDGQGTIATGPPGSEEPGTAASGGPRTRGTPWDAGAGERTTPPAASPRRPRSRRRASGWIHWYVTATPRSSAHASSYRPHSPPCTACTARRARFLRVRLARLPSDTTAARATPHNSSEHRDMLIKGVPSCKLRLMLARRVCPSAVCSTPCTRRTVL